MEQCENDGEDFLEDGESWKEFREWVIVRKNQDEKAKKFFNLATAASITGFVRAKLWRAICECDRPFYCDTDSLIVNMKGASRLFHSGLLHDNMLGKLKLEESGQGARGVR